ncbi:hypothetical protein GCM10009616_37350 [Microlunatus lacustris]
MSFLLAALVALATVAAVVGFLTLVIPPAVRALVDRPTEAELEPAPPSTPPAQPPAALPAVPVAREELTEADYAAINELERSTGQEVTDYSAEIAVLRARERPAVRALLNLRDLVAAVPTHDAAAAAAAYSYLSAIEELIEVERGNVTLVVHADQARARFRAAQQQFGDVEQQGSAGD